MWVVAHEGGLHVSPFDSVVVDAWSDSIKAKHVQIVIIGQSSHVEGGYALVKLVQAKGKESA